MKYQMQAPKYAINAVATISLITANFFVHPTLNSTISLRLLDFGAQQKIMMLSNLWK